MSGRRWRWFAVLTVLAALDLGLSVKANLDFHRTPTGPSVMTLGQLLGWVSSALLIIVAASLLIGGLAERRRRRRHSQQPTLR